MRSLLLASAAVLFTAGLACAQTTSAAPAPESGAPGLPVAQQGMSPGKQAPNGDVAGTSSSMGTSAAPAAGAMSSAAPAPEGAQNAPQLSAPGASYGKTASAPTYQPGGMTNSESGSTATGPLGQKTASSGMGMTSPGMTHTHHTWSHGWSGGMPADADAHTYLRIASMAIKHHDRATADEALSRAETRMLTRSVPASGSMTDDSPAITAVENARQAVDAGKFQQAAMDTDQAMHHHMMGGMGSGMGASSAAMSRSSSMDDSSSGATMPGQGTSSPGMSAGASSGAQQ